MLSRHGRTARWDTALLVLLLTAAGCGGEGQTQSTAAEFAPVRAGDADPAAWVLNVCLIEQGYVPPFRGVRGSPSDFDVPAAARTACRDFLAPIRLSAAEQKVHDCLGSIGVSFDPRLPSDRRITADEARRVIECAPPSPPSAGTEFMGCMAGQGAGLPLPLDDDAQRAASAACAHLMPPRVRSSPSTPYAALIECLTKHGYEPAVGTPSKGPTPLPEFHAAVEACQTHLPDNSSQGPDFVRLEQCKIEQGILPYPYFNFDASNREAAAQVCAGIFSPPGARVSDSTHAPVPDETQRYLDCLRANGVAIDAATLSGGPATAISVERASAAARACRDADPIRSNIEAENHPFYDCLADNGVLSRVTQARNTGPTVQRSAEVACAAHFPLRPVYDDANLDYAECLRENGLKPRLGSRPDFDTARRAFVKCEPRYQ